ncbi:MAG: efflux RND transporter periplasmic adaptor subunit, partial [Acidobacteriota bacterium]
KVLVRELANGEFPGKITRMARALDPDLHVMQTEVDVPNPDGTLLPGMYVLAELTLPVPHRVLEIPATALYNDSLGLRVATVDPHNRIHFVKISIERDTGASLWIATGLTGDEHVLKISVPTLAEGDLVEVNAAAAAGSGAAK